MRCPICRLEMMKDKFGDARVGVCKTGCRGIWITYKDLIRIGEKNEGFGASLNEALNAPGVGDSERGQILCPECQIPMHVHKYRSTINIVVDECYKCGGFFLDPGELKGIREAFRKSEEKELYVQFLLKDIPGYSQMKLDSEKLEDRANAIKSFTDFRYLNLPFTDIPYRIPSSSGRKAEFGFDQIHKPDSLEKGLRFGCGSLLGLLVGAYFFQRFFFESIGVGLFIIVVVSVLCGIAAMKKGDRFWNSIKH